MSEPGKPRNSKSSGKPRRPRRGKNAQKREHTHPGGAGALLVIDAKGVIRWSYLSPIGVNPGADGILQALEGMQSEQAPSSPVNTSHEPTNRSSVRA